MKLHIQHKQIKTHTETYALTVFPLLYRDPIIVDHSHTHSQKDKLHFCSSPKPPSLLNLKRLMDTIAVVQQSTRSTTVSYHTKLPNFLNQIQMRPPHTRGMCSIQCVEMFCCDRRLKQSQPLSFPFSMSQWRQHACIFKWIFNCLVYTNLLLRQVSL